MAKFHSNSLLVVIFFLLAFVFVLRALIALLLALELLLSYMPFSDKTVNNIKAVHVLGIAALPFVDQCHQSRNLAIFPLELAHRASDLFLPFRNTDALRVVLRDPRGRHPPSDTAPVYRPETFM